MDGMDISTFEEIDQGMFDVFSGDSDEDESVPLPDRIGLDSALQDDEKSRLETLSKLESNNKSKRERELELSLLPPGSIRRQILARSIRGELYDTSNESDHERDHESGLRPDILEGSTSIDARETTSSSGYRLRRAKPTDNHESQLDVMNIAEKAGMSGIDKVKINNIIHEASKGSKFYKKQAERQSEIHRSIEKMLNKVKSASPEALHQAQGACDRMIEDIEKQRIFNRIIVHIDLDMFYAAVEIRDNPNLEGKPVAVGGNAMIATSNYVARRFGVRAAMPGFIAKKLCPTLIIIPTNGAKYRQASSEVFSIFEQYDPDFTNTSLDEAYLDLTDYVRSTLERDGLEFQEHYDGTLPKIWWTRANEIVSEIRQAVVEKTQLTCSAGVACNTLLAKISTDINKPDGQYMVEGYPRDVLDFISKTPVEKISGIGKVTAQFLNALDIKTCGDILPKRHYLPIVFMDINARFYLKVALGDGSTEIKSDEQRKSKSVERTFSAVKDPLTLLDKLDSICEELCTKYLKPYKIQGRTVTLKIKRNTFTTTTKSFSLLLPTNDKIVIYPAARNLLMSVITNEPPEISYRLLGVKLSNLSDDGIMSNQLTIDAMFRNQELSKTTKSSKIVHEVDDDDEQEPSLPPIASTSQSSSRGSSISDRVESPQSKLSSELNGKPRGRKRTNSSPDQPNIASFFNKIPRRASPEATTSNSDTNTRRANDDEEVFYDASDDYQCPFCFKSVPDFYGLQTHVENCRYKTTIDVNKSLIAPRSQAASTPTRKTHQTKNAKEGDKQRVKGKTQRGPLNSLNHSISKPSSSRGTRSQASASSSHSTKPSFYQQFMESNSQRLSQAQKREPMRCPHCYHGFLDFPTLETHSMNCTKKPEPRDKSM